MRSDSDQPPSSPFLGPSLSLSSKSKNESLLEYFQVCVYSHTVLLAFGAKVTLLGTHWRARVWVLALLPILASNGTQQEAPTR